MHSINFTFTSITPLESVLDGYMNNVKLQVAAMKKKFKQIQSVPG